MFRNLTKAAVLLAVAFAVLAFDPSSADAAPFLEKRGITFPSYVAGKDALGRIYSNDEAWVPLMILLNTKREVRSVYSGMAEIVEDLESLTRE